MPIYGYRCEQCGHEVEVLQSMSEEPLRVCPNCTGPLRKMIYPAGIIFKGSGYYTTDYKSPGSGSRHGDSDAAAAASSSSGGDSASGSKGDAKSESKGDAKSESKGDAKSESKGDAKSEPKGDAKSEPKPAAKPSSPSKSAPKEGVS